MSTTAPRPPRADTQEGRILAVLSDGRPHTLYDWDPRDRYTGRNAVSRLVNNRGYRIKSWKAPGSKVQTDQLVVEQAELALTTWPGETRERCQEASSPAFDG